mmetsp:Transcript_84463/g.239467  ORF Transcript_84463/g.239467 Transcript_84463/m.239467 type:complete len:230 (-) Transcript_84463:208-897(-)
MVVLEGYIEEEWHLRVMRIDNTQCLLREHVVAVLLRVPDHLAVPAHVVVGPVEAPARPVGAPEVHGVAAPAGQPQRLHGRLGLRGLVAEGVHARGLGPVVLGSVEIAEVSVEAPAVRCLPHVLEAHVPFADHVRGIARLLQLPRQRRHLRRGVPVACPVAQDDLVHVVGEPPSHDGRARGRAVHGDVGPVKLQALAHEPVRVRRDHVWVVPAHVVPPEIVHDEHHYVRP